MSVLELLSEKYGHPVEYFEGDTFDINLFKIEQLFERKSYYEHTQDFYLKYEKKNPYLKLSLMFFCLLLFKFLKFGLACFLHILLGRNLPFINFSWLFFFTHNIIK